MGLLNYLTATSLDEDYAQAHAARARAAAQAGREGAGADGAAAGERRSTRPRTAALVVLALFGLLVATAAVQTSRGAADADARHAALVKQVVSRKNILADELDRARSLRSETETLQRVYLQATTQGRALQTRLTRLGVVTGAAPARGPGVRIVVDDGPPVPGDDNQVLDVDLQKMVNGLWLSGAEAIAINRERLTSLSAIRLAGGVMTVNYHRISPPYTIEAIGNPDNLAARFVDTPGGQWWLDLQALYGLQFEINTVTDQEPLTLPAARRTALRHAHTPETLR
jgi:uncharacterized protein YlxW (UPF0749 family)